jgi:hypothetical protein
MFKHKTLFVLGAGSSQEVGMPVGKPLADLIKDKMDIRFEFGTKFIGTGDFDLFQQLAFVVKKDATEFQKAAHRLQDGLSFADSIDAFLDQHRNDQFVQLYGTAGIVKTILERERDSDVFLDPTGGKPRFDDTKLSKTWFNKFVAMLSLDVDRTDFARIFNNVDFITFNYDRCLEQYLMHALSRSYSMRVEEAEAMVKKLQILHVYGSLGDLKDLPFGADRFNLLDAMQGIKTYTEQTAVTGLLDQIREKVERAERVVFLGFAYHVQGMTLLKVKNRTKKIVYGTAFDMSEPKVQAAKRAIDDALGKLGQKYIDNKLKCADLFDYYGQDLSS